MAGRGTATGTASKLYTVELGRHRCIEILKECLGRTDKEGNSLIQHDPELGCALYLGRVSSDGHWQIQRAARYITRESTRAAGSGAHRAYYVHRIAYVALHGQDILQTGSHLCGNANCFNPYHIKDESQNDNNDRQRCLGFVVCEQHGHVLHRLCQHNPPCIKRPVKAVSCCVSLSQRVIADSQAESQESLGDKPPVAVPILTMPLVQPVSDFLNSLQAQPIPDSEQFATSVETAEDQIMSDSQDTNQDAGQSQALPGYADEGDEWEDVPFVHGDDLPSTSQGPDYADG